MAQFIAFNSDMEVSTEAIRSVIEGLGPFKNMAMEILRSVGIHDVSPGLWYNQQAWLNAFKMIAEKIGSSTLYMIGQKIPENALWPPEIDTIEKGLASIDIAYHMNHRLHNEVLYNPKTQEMKEGIGHYRFELVEPKKVKMFCDNLYPCDFDRGIITAVARKFKPLNTVVLIKHDDEQPCRKKGDESCTYWVTW